MLRLAVNDAMKNLPKIRVFPALFLICVLSTGIAVAGHDKALSFAVMAMVVNDHCRLGLDKDRTKKAVNLFAVEEGYTKEQGIKIIRLLEIAWADKLAQKPDRSLCKSAKSYLSGTGTRFLQIIQE